MVMEVQNMESIKDGDVLVDFYSTDCGPCKALNPVLEEISKEFTNLKVAKVEVSKNPSMSQRFGIMTLPTVMFLKNSQVKEVYRGYSGKHVIRSMIEKYVHA